MKSITNNSPVNATSNFPSAKWTGKSILIVDDLKVNYLLLKAMIARTGANTIWADNGFTAIEIVKQEQKIDLVLMDYNMPGIDGLETTKRIKSLNPKLPVVSQSTYTDSVTFDRDLAPYDAYLSKPINARELLGIMDAFIAE